LSQQLNLENKMKMKYKFPLSVLFCCFTLAYTQAQNIKSIESVYNEERLYIDPVIDSDKSEELRVNGKQLINEFYVVTDFYDGNTEVFSEEKMIAFKKMFVNGSNQFYDFMLSKEKTEVDEFADGLFIYDFEGPLSYEIDEISAVSIERDNEGRYFINYNVSAQIYSELVDEESIVNRSKSELVNLTFSLQAEEPNLSRITIYQIIEGHIAFKKVAVQVVEDDEVIASEPEDLDDGDDSDYRPSTVSEPRKEVNRFSEIDYGLNLIYGKISNPDLASSSVIGGGLYINRYSTFRKTDKLMWFVGAELDYFNINSSKDNLGSLGDLFVPYRYLEENGESIESDRTPGTLLLNGNEAINETLNLFSLSPRLGISGIFKEDKDYAHSWKAFVSGEIWVDGILNNRIDLTDSNGEIARGRIRPDPSSDLPFPSTLDTSIEETYYSAQLGNLSVDPFVDAGLQFAIGVGYSYQRFRDYDKGLKVGIELMFHPSVIKEASGNQDLASITYVDEIDNKSNEDRIYNVIPSSTDQSDIALLSILGKSSGNTPLFELKLKLGFFKRNDKD